MKIKDVGPLDSPPLSSLRTQLDLMTSGTSQSGTVSRNMNELHLSLEFLNTPSGLESGELRTWIELKMAQGFSLNTLRDFAVKRTQDLPVFTTSRFRAELMEKTRIRLKDELESSDLNDDSSDSIVEKMDMELQLSMLELEQDYLESTSAELVADSLREG